MKSSSDKPHYRAYMLRLWDEQTRPDLPGDWRFSLEDARSGYRLGFSSLEAMIDYLQNEIASFDVPLQPSPLDERLSPDMDDNK